MLRISERDLHYDAQEGIYLYGNHPFTGIAFTTFSNGLPMSETQYREGLISGISRGWWESGSPETEARYLCGALHGESRTWYATGQLAEEELHEHGILVRSSKWDEVGTLIETYELQESDPAYEALLRNRQVYNGEDSGDN